MPLVRLRTQCNIYVFAAMALRDAATYPSRNWALLPRHVTLRISITATLVSISSLEYGMQHVGCGRFMRAIRSFCHAKDTDSHHPRSWVAPKRALLLAKLSKYDFERSLENATDDIQLRKTMIRKGVNVDWLITRHNAHYQKLAEFQRIMKSRDIEVHVVDRNAYTADAIAWADIVFTAGGDGTFLLGASKISSRDKVLVGLNTDPNFSVGYLCLPKWCTQDLSQALGQLLSGNFDFQWRQRIRTMVQHRADEPLKMELLDKRKPVATDGWPPGYGHPLESPNGDLPSPHDSHTCCTQLPMVALNEVFVGESMSARVSQYEISVDDAPSVRHKSSGVTVSTGTGSTSWYQQIASLRPSTVASLLEMAQRLYRSERLEHISPVTSRPNDGPPIATTVHRSQTTAKESNDDHPFSLELAARVTEMYNATIPFDPEDERIAFVVRDPLCNAVFRVDQPQGFANRVQIRSMMLDSHLVLDGGCTFPLHYGAVAEFSIHTEDALCCVRLRQLG